MKSNRRALSEQQEPNVDPLIARVLGMHRMVAPSELRASEYSVAAPMPSLPLGPNVERQQGRRVFLACASDKWARMTADAKGIDRVAVASESHRGHVDADAHLCSMQRQQAREGYVLATIETNIYGFCVRDTLNDGLGTLHTARDGGSAEAAVAFAMRWHAEAPGKREVILGFVWGDDKKDELAAAIAKAKASAA